MNSEQLTQILKEAFPEAEVVVSGQAGKFDLRIVDDQFEGKRTRCPPTSSLCTIKYLYCKWRSSCRNNCAMTKR